jgi:hypothetical protein
VLVSDQPGAVPSAIFQPFAPTPIGNDISFEFGDKMEKPVFGNFDPPVADTVPDGGGPSVVSYQNSADRHDVNNDGFVTPADALRVINALNQFGTGRLSTLLPADSQYAPPQAYLDVNGDSFATPADVLGVINRLNDVGPVGEGESVVFERADSWLTVGPRRVDVHRDQPVKSQSRQPVSVDHPAATEIDDAIADIAVEQRDRREESQDLEEAIDEILRDWDT